MSKQRIGLFGGSFNPVHLGHLIVAQDALEQFELDGLVFVPCSIPVHKAPESLISFEHRHAMLQLAVESDLCFSVSSVDHERGGFSYAIDTVTALQEHNPDHEYCFIIGADTLLELHTWYRIYELLERCEILTVCRPGYAVTALREQIRLADPWPEKLSTQVASTHWVDISSTDVRMRIAEGMRISYLVPSSVEMYIAEHHLYCS